MVKCLQLVNFMAGHFIQICAPNHQNNAALYHNDKPIFKKICVSGAIDWNVDKNLLYHVDTCDPVVREYKWDPKSCIQQNFVRLWKWMLEIGNDVKFQFDYICSISSTNVLGPFQVLGLKKKIYPWIQRQKSNMWLILTPKAILNARFKISNFGWYN